MTEAAPSRLCRKCYSRQYRVWPSETEFYWECESCQERSDLRRGKRYKTAKSYIEALEDQERRMSRNAEFIE